jgi:hypothetical protein
MLICSPSPFDRLTPFDRLRDRRVEGRSLSLSKGEREYMSIKIA